MSYFLFNYSLSILVSFPHPKLFPLSQLSQLSFHSCLLPLLTCPYIFEFSFLLSLFFTSLFSPLLFNLLASLSCFLLTFLSPLYPLTLFPSFFIPSSPSSSLFFTSIFSSHAFLCILSLFPSHFPPQRCFSPCLCP